LNFVYYSDNQIISEVKQSPIKCYKQGVG